jgi:hypothetical protein
MFRPYKTMFKQLFTSLNCRIAPVLISMHPMLLHIVVPTKMSLFENVLSLFAPRYFHFAESILCPLSCVVPISWPCVPCIRKYILSEAIPVTGSGGP